MHKDKQKLLESGLSYEVREHPFSNISRENRIKIIDETRIKSLDDYKVSLESLLEIFEEYDIVTILSYLSDISLMGGMGNNKLKSFSSLEQSELEVCQALVFHIDFEKSQNKRPTFEVFQEIIDLLKKLLQSNILKMLDSKLLELSEKDVNIHYFRNYMISHTQYVRNWGTFEQINSISSELYGQFDNELSESYGFTISQANKFFNYIISSLEKDATAKMLAFRKIKNASTVEEMVFTYHEFINADKSKTDNFFKFLKKHNITDKEYIFVELIYAHYSDVLLSSHFIFNYEEVANILNIEVDVVVSLLNTFSYQPKEDNNIEHIFLNNPIWTKPIIILDEESFFCPNPMLYFSFILKIFDDLIDEIEPIKLSKSKAEYLEEKIEQIVKNKLPDAKIYKSFKWDKYENDLVVFIDTYILIIEAKSGKITDSALRGSSSRLKKKVKELLVAPAIQSQRLKNKIEYLIQNPSKEDPLRDKMPMDLNEYSKVLRVSVSFEYLSFLQSGIMMLDKTGWLPHDFIPCPTMNIASFETVFDIFDNPIELINYLEMREELEVNVKYQGDELDLISYYMETHLLLGEIDESMHLVLTGQAKTIDDYYQIKEHGIEIKKPRPIMHDFFRKIVLQLEERKPLGWVRMGSILYRLDPTIQEKLAEEIMEVEKKLKSLKREENYLNKMIYIPNDLSQYGFCYVLYDYENYHKRYDFIDDAVQETLENREHCLVIAKNLDVDEHAYSFISIVKKE